MQPTPVISLCVSPTGCGSGWIVQPSEPSPSTRAWLSTVFAVVWKPPAMQNAVERQVEFSRES